MTTEEQKAKRREYDRQYRARNREKIRKQKRDTKRRYRAENPEKIREQDRRYRERHPTQIKTKQEQTRSQLRRLRAWVSAYKMACGCIDCGYCEHPAALQFDHISGQKTINVSQAATMKRVQAEMAKCVVRCANCHAIKHFDETQNLKSKTPRETSPALFKLD